MDIKLTDLLKIIPDTVYLTTNNESIPDQYRSIAISARKFKDIISNDISTINRTVDMVFPIRSFVPLVETLLVIRLKKE